MKEGIVLFAHGSRDPGWAAPFERIARALSESFLVQLAYLERMKPELGDAIASLVEKDANRIRIVPVFLGVGAHIKEDLPKLVEAARARHPGVELVLEQTIGERKEVTDAIAAVIYNGFSDQSR